MVGSGASREHHNNSRHLGVKVDKWSIIHRTRKLIEEGRLPPLTCSLCDARVHVRIGRSDEPMLRCTSSHDAFPGESWWIQLDKMNGDA